MGQEKNKFGDCEVGDWVDWNDHPMHTESNYLTGHKRSIKDFDMDNNNMVHVLPMEEWEFKKAWVCVRKSRP